MFRGYIPAESILKKEIAKEVYDYSGDYLSQQQLRSVKIKNLQDTHIKFIKVPDQIKKIGIIRIRNKTGFFDEYDYHMLNISKTSSPELISKEQNININF